MQSTDLYNQLREIYFWIFDVSYVMEMLGRNDYGTAVRRAAAIIIDMMEEEEKRFRGWINPPYVRVGSLKEAYDMVTEANCYLNNILVWTDLPGVRRSRDQLNKGEKLMKQLLEDEVKRIKDKWSKERKEEENRKKKEDFDRLNRNWMKIQAKFRSMNHPDWMPEEEKKKGLITRLRLWIKKWRK